MILYDHAPSLLISALYQNRFLDNEMYNNIPLSAFQNLIHEDISISSDS